MSVYFCIEEVLTRLEAEPEALQAMVPVTREPPHCGGFGEDAFILGSQPTLLDTTNPQAESALAALITEVSLYRYNMELALDEALAERHGSRAVLAALEKAFAGQALPNTLRGAAGNADELGGSLRHPMLEHLTAEQLAQIYLGFLRAQGPETPFSFERAILGKHPERFAAHFDGFLDQAGGKIKAEILIAFGMRIDHEKGGAVDSYLDNGQRKARRMNVQEPRELLWVWLEADHYQMRRCAEIHALKLLPGLPRLPNWVRADIFAVLEKESMKQSFAGLLRRAGDTLLAGMPLIRRAVTANADGQVDELLQQLLAQTLNISAPYSGAAGKFAASAQKRQAEAKQAGMA